MTLRLTPRFSDYFKSFYYSNTYVPPVDLSEQALSRHLLAVEHPDAAAIAQRIISTPEVQQVLSEPLTYDLEGEVSAKNAILQQHGFTLLSSTLNLLTGKRVPFYSVIKHDELQGWIIKSGVARGPKGQIVTGLTNDRNEVAFFTEEESLLRIEMASRIQRIAQDAGIKVVLPRKKLVAYANLDGVTELCRRYCVVCEDIDILSVAQTVQAIKDMDGAHQREVARQISTIVEKAGLVDASFDNIRFTRDGQLAFIDTEPGGLMVVGKHRCWHKCFGPKGASVEKCARIGLYTLVLQTSKLLRGTASILDNARLQCEPGLEEFRAEVEARYAAAIAPKLSKRKIVVSVMSLGVVPLIDVIRALVKTCLCNRTMARLRAIDTRFQRRNISLDLRPQAEQQRELRRYQAMRTPVAKKYFAQIEGVPFVS